MIRSSWYDQEPKNKLICTRAKYFLLLRFPLSEDKAFISYAREFTSMPGAMLNFANLKNQKKQTCQPNRLHSGRHIFENKSLKECSVL